MVTDSTNIGFYDLESFKLMLNKRTDMGEFTAPVSWKVSQNLADLLGDGIKAGDYLVWDPERRELISHQGWDKIT